MQNATVSSAWQVASCTLRCSAGFLVDLVECLLDIAHSLLDLTFHLLRNAFGLLGFVTSQFSNLLLDFARYILGSAFQLIAVHGVLLKRDSCAWLTLLRFIKDVASQSASKQQNHQHDDDHGS
jgi:hypothetical protein